MPEPLVITYGQHTVSLVPQDAAGARDLVALRIEKKRQFPRRHDGRENDPVFYGIFGRDKAREMFNWLGVWLHKN